MIEQSLRGHGKLPDPIANAPELLPWLPPYYSAFEELLTERSEDGFSGDVGAIPWTSVNAYAYRHQTGVGRDFEKLLMYVRALDFHHRKLIRAARPKPVDKGGKTGKPASKAPRPPRRRPS